jgi:hypothetical protein
MFYKISIFLLSLSVFSSHGADLQLQQISQVIVIDAVLDDSAWQQAQIIQLNYETKPGNNSIPAIRTEAMLLEGNNMLYVAFRAYDPAPQDIRAFMRDRDNGGDDDKVLITIDTFNTSQIAYSFVVNALGVQTDIVRNEVNDEDSTNWDTTWESAGRITDFGYAVEMAIPLNALRFPHRDSQEWRINLERSYPRDQKYRYALNPKDRNNSCVICQYSIMRGFTDAKPSTNLEFTPFLVYSNAQSSDFEASSSKENNTEVGLDIRWGITPNMSMNATINPDFSQVEADAAQINVNDQFDTDLAEKRRFFLEGADYFQTNIDLVYTRNIVDPDYGAKFTVKDGQHTLGVIIAEDNQTDITLPSSDDSFREQLTERGRAVKNVSTIARYQYQLGKGLALGTLLTKRKSSDANYENNVLSVDAFWQINDTDRFYAQMMHSDTDYPILFQTKHDQEDNISDNAYFLKYDHETESWHHTLRYQKFGNDFRADSGFITQVDYQKYTAKGGYTWYSEDNWWSEMVLKVDLDITHDEAGNLLKKELESELEIEGIWQSNIEISGGNRDEVYKNVTYPETFYGIEINSKPFAGIDLTVILENGDTIDTDNERPGKERKKQFIAELNIGKHVLLEATWEQETLDVAGGQLYTAEAQYIRLNYQFTNSSRLRLTFITEEVDRDTSLYLNQNNEYSKENQRNVQVVYSYKIDPQSALFIGYGDNAYSDNETLASFTDEKSFFIKVSYAGFW